MQRLLKVLRSVLLTAVSGLGLALIAVAIVLTAYFVGWKTVPAVPAAAGASAASVRPDAPLHGTCAIRRSSSETGRAARVQPCAAALARQLACRRDRRSTQARAVAEIAGLSADEVRQALSELENGPTTGLLLELRLLLLQRWASLDPRAAWNYLRAGTGDFREVPGLGSVESALLGRWARADPEGALQAWHELDTQAQQANSFALQQIFFALAARDPDRAQSLADSLGPEYKGEAWAGLARTARHEAHRENLLSKLSALPAGDLRVRALGEALNAWAETGRAAEAVQWLNAANLDGNERGQIEERMVIPFFNQDHRAAADWLMASADTPDRRTRRLEMVVGLWAPSDPTPAGQWLISQGLDADAARAMRLYADLVSANYPVEAVAWARSMPDEAMRQQALAQLEAKLRQRYPNRIAELLNAQWEQPPPQP